ncbi:MAG: diadenylate cyclase CdaA [Clostridia bacterium]|nr:diadenylate cyclase CdaA [Clostridia bacterium]MBR5544538.1 diadenylate cyclase CdaA [Clostridia bacterium]
MTVDFIVDLFENIKRALLSFGGIVDLLDVVLVALVIYGAVSLIRGTRAFQLAKGVVVLAVIYFIVTMLEMKASEFILNFIFGNLLMILVVIFAPEIRHALEKMGRGSATISNIFNFKNKDESEIQENIKDSINSVCRACAEMSDNKVGALIVFEKDTLLGEISKTGTNIDAAVTTELIVNIFFPKAPLHDGAVIVKDGRVVSAGCILPLTNNLLSRELGTRHRAAVGMSESSDAIVVVVSEETGSISVAQNGTLKRKISDGDLREVLMKNFIKEEDKEPGKIKKILRGNKNEK